MGRIPLNQRLAHIFSTMTTVNITLRCPQRGNIQQTIDPQNPPTLGDLGKSVGGIFASSSSQWFDHKSGNPEPVNSNMTVEVGGVYSATSNVKAGV